MISTGNKLPLAASLCGLLLAGSVVAQDEAQVAANTAELLELVRQAELIQSQEIRDREAAFVAERNSQQRFLDQENATRIAEERRAEQLEDTFNANELIIADKQDQLEERLGALRELFGHLTGAAGDARENLELSIVSAQYPSRTDFLEVMIAKMSSTTELPSIAEIERLWAEMLHEIVESGNVSKFSTSVASPDGQVSQREIVRIGNYNLVSDGEYLSYDANTGRVTVLPSQPKRFTGDAADIQNSTASFNRVGIDPTGSRGGTFLKAIIASPTLEQKWHQGGTVGYIITGLFGVAMLISFWRLIVLMGVSGKVSKQLKSNKALSNNPLGRVLAIQEQNPSIDTETLELKLNEQILKERPAIEAWVNIVKIIAAVAPLMGLLGTVTGMIVVFQGITLFGAGDVQGMAGGISQALVTTVLGLCVAIPTILLHTLLNSRAMRIVHILDEQAAGIVAEKSEAN
jgi:biopolymer transport protein ExbB